MPSWRWPAPRTTASRRMRRRQRLRRAVAAAPFMVAGSGRFDTRLMEALGERVFCKVGAEGVYTAALPELGLGVAVKVDDGQARAAEVVMATLVGALLPLDAPARAVVDGLAAPVLRRPGPAPLSRPARAPAGRCRRRSAATRPHASPAPGPAARAGGCRAGSRRARPAPSPGPAPAALAAHTGRCR
ncbi:asparaginase [Piscinibacter sakaiensis]|uniref:asparaginase n=1 Tax=Piscinibacter sakaiensis TaxID=1547922 RepID=UPI00372AE8CE